MLYFHSCPKCKKGTIEYGSDEQGKYIICLMCGFYKNSAQDITKARKA
jgi:Zn ribbon nucleic-acid-binding protein